MIRDQLFLSWRTRRRNVSASRRRDRGDASEAFQISHIVIFTILEIRRIPTA
jgi:hypothetical protein